MVVARYITSNYILVFAFTVFSPRYSTKSLIIEKALKWKIWNNCGRPDITSGGGV